MHRILVDINTLIATCTEYKNQTNTRVLYHLNYSDIPGKMASMIIETHIGLWIDYSHGIT